MLVWWITVLAILIFSAILHEIAHGWMALKFGDPTAKLAGRLTLNPIPHIDPLMSLLLPAALILMGSPFILGGAKPVPIDPSRFFSYRKGMFWVSFAGVATNFLLAIVFGLILRLLLLFSVGELATSLLALMVFINLILGLFNLIPIPPLDGSKLLGTILNLSPHQQQNFDRLGMFGLLIVIILLPFLSPIISFAINGLFFLLTGAAFHF
ncbi:MAG: hypothetical protein A2745_01540 [Candidatus Harrisonbacteria bacterium RIFCSPHIGHO2_01_FULL_44_13]|uniref:Peptidase M50 domain-containing protein n=1 Tax=Candidatus Harrisonbacteria bacterium RIFCSPLOWO2_01_FULL_44_18 TaxID=1798407 RepID=A0A1G1ZKZ6_9BACT|nr:MAG: hypothetical protein A2745_01540 [Candidatus Harrisonbacteria bacterium RIFCSPHIGHO2_01_FULL_44_13]OGY65224.1 MAG: hypothetical protein A3A16_00500 [Candidatus Harrisonbacteria bacterium RIFCSPLOWO2_01_FULL_44_18]